MNTKYGLKELERDYGVLTFGDALKSFRLCEEISQKESSLQLGISQSSLCDLEKGRRIPSVARAVKIAKLIGMPEGTWVQLLIQDSLRRENLNFDVVLNVS